MPTVRNTEGVDLIVSEPMGGKSVAVQVKTSQGSAKKWVLSHKCETLKKPSLYYVFVNLGLPGELPKYHIVSSETVASTVRREYAAWVKTHNPTTMRAFWDKPDKYLDDWAALGLAMVE